MEEDLEADAELLGLKRKKKPAATAPSAAAEGPAAEADTGAAVATTAGDDVEMTPAEQHDELVRVGFVSML